MWPGIFRIRAIVRQIRGQSFQSIGNFRSDSEAALEIRKPREPKNAGDAMSADLSIVLRQQAKKCDESCVAQPGRRLVSPRIRLRDLLHCHLQIVQRMALLKSVLPEVTKNLRLIRRSGEVG